MCLLLNFMQYIYYYANAYYCMLGKLYKKTVQISFMYILSIKSVSSGHRFYVQVCESLIIVSLSNKYTLCASLLQQYLLLANLKKNREELENYLKIRIERKVLLSSVVKFICLNFLINTSYFICAGICVLIIYNS